MGMAASQARLLALTARMHDIELKAQNLQAQKISLATQEDEAYQKYCEALDATKIQVGRIDATSTGGISYVDANYSTVCGFQQYNCRQYSMINNLTGKVIVTPEIKNLYEQYSNDKYAFAWAAMGYENQFMWSGNAGPFGPAGSQFGPEEVGIGTGQNNIAGPEGDPPFSYGYGSNGESDVYMTEVEYAVFLNHYNQGGSDTLSRTYDELLQSSINGDRPSKRRELLNAFRDALYSNYGQEILDAMNQNKNIPYDPDFPSSNFDSNFDGNQMWSGINSEFKYYQNLFDQITLAGGCETLDEQFQSGEQGTEWFNNMVTSGLVSLYVLDTSKDKGWEVTTIATSVGNNYLQEVNDEEKAKKAEVEYEHEMKIINRKDTKFDTALKNLETEEQACKTEIDSIKTVRDNNIERTFNLFS